MKRTTRQKPDKDTSSLKHRLDEKNFQLKIESALEKVRSVALKMKKPDDMLKICKMISVQLTSLGVKEIRNVQTAIIYPERNTYMNYEYYAKHDKTFITENIYNNDKGQKAFAKKMLQGKGGVLIAHVKGKRLKDWVAYQKTTEQFVDKYLFNAESLNYYWYSLGPVALGISTYHPLTKEDENLFKRFLKVFEMAYRRYLDIEKAEAQARETQIEAALEKVRGASMAMHKSEELAGVVALLDKEIAGLGILVDNSTIITNISEPENGLDNWPSRQGQNFLEKFHIPYFEDPVAKTFVQALKKGVNYYSDQYSKNEKDKHFRLLFRYSDFKKTSKERQQFLFSTPGWTRANVVSKNSVLIFQRFNLNNFTVEEEGIFKRFGKVFEQAYTRFLDLQKAEAQAREAQIEAALEKVRAQSMAMHQSKELVGVVRMLDKELNGLGIEINGSQIITDFTNPKEGVNSWYAREGQTYLEKFHVPNSDFPQLHRFWQAREKSLAFYTEKYSKAEKNRFFRWLYRYSDFKKLPKERQEFVYRAPVWIRATVLSRNSVMQFQRLNHAEFTREEEDIFKRFAKVFEQAYTRFLDLQKAEAQAREAQIEAALERVRTASMGMYNSNELKDVVRLLYKEFRLLITDFNTVNIQLNMDATKDLYFWAGVEEDVYPEIYHWVATDLPVFEQVDKAWKSGDGFVNKVFNREEKDAFFNEAFKIQPVPQKRRRMIRDSEGMIIMGWFQKYSGIDLLRYNHEPFDEGEIQIVKRFSEVFEQTYTRFLDLQKAEAQAKEAEMEAALERVRAASMAMHKSLELQEVILVVSQQLLALGIQLDSTLFVKVLEDGSWDVWNTTPTQTYPAQLHIPFTRIPPMTSVNKAYAQGKNEIALRCSKREKDKFLGYFFTKTAARKIPAARKKYVLNSPGWALSFFFMKHIILGITTLSGIPFSEEENAIFRRFKKVFEQAYTRFLDLQKAETQAREAQIEAALERVRAQSMAMHKSEELVQVVRLLDNEIAGLGIIVDNSSILTDISEPEKGLNNWIARQGQNYLEKFHIPYLDHSITKKFLHAIKRGVNYYSDKYSKPEKDKYFRLLFKYSDFRKVPKERQQFILSTPGWTRAIVVSKNSTLIFQRHNLTDFTIEEEGIFKRFGKVFEQAYTRFLDLQKAEAQSRESQIQLALERVRARTMAMQHSEELSDMLSVMFEQFDILGIKPVHTYLSLYDLGNNLFSFRMTGKAGHRTIAEQLIDLNASNEWRDAVENFKKGKPDQVISYHTAVENIPQIFKLFEKIVKKIPAKYRPSISDYPNGQFITQAYHRFGYLGFSHNREATEEEKSILVRFANEFNRSYQRFLDLQKAEAQAREAQIQLALERVRARTMAMQHSEELSDMLSVMFEQFDILGISPVFTFLTLVDMANNRFSFRMTGKAGHRNITEQLIDLNASNEWTHATENFKKGKPDQVICYRDPVENLARVFDLFSVTLQKIPLKFRPGLSDYPNGQFITEAYHRFGYLGFSHNREATEEEKSILVRFANEFNRSYQRFLDLQKAELQAKEAQIEAALERVRAKAIGMHNSNDLSDTVSMVFTELRKLGVTPIRSGVGLFNKESRRVQLYSATSSKSGDSLSLVGWVELENHPVLEKIYETWLQQEEYFPGMQGAQLRKYYQLLLAGLSVPIPDFKKDQKQFGHFIPFSIGCLYAWSDEHFSENQLKIFRRFASIVDLTFRRYFELKQSEANAKEAIKQAALDRIRADIASMRTVQDLDRITPLIWNELTILGIPFIRCGVFIMDESLQLIHTFLSTPDGKAIAAFHIPYDTPGKIRLIPEYWQKKSAYIDHWNDSDFIGFANTLLEQKIINSTEQYLSTIPHGGFYLHFFPFLQGMLYVGNTTKLGTDDTGLIQSVADAFSTAYARYEDFNKLEAAKKQVDSTLNELQTTQKQLIQSEKMASLGELTAGIAHEIQNPLNFVNNFSEVSKELLEEMRTALENGDKDEAEEIANDIIQNLEKINQHGKRADGIVKGMLQHSRKSEGKKEPTDINALCDEYLRLSYHGMRAKDKNFNVDFKTDFDSNIEKINIIPQDIGRVLLNLYNNAFYACAERSRRVINQQKSKNSDLYQPTVWVNTKKEGDSVIITVGDNGGGIPQKIVDKIFQPFFTTKPTGSGTGLGLSLSYDIVKAHDGELKVETKEGEGCEFIITLPV